MSRAAESADARAQARACAPRCAVRQQRQFHSMAFLSRFHAIRFLLSSFDSQLMIDGFAFFA